MKLSLQEGLYDAGGFRQFVCDAKGWGFEAVEVWGEGLAGRVDEVARVLREEGLAASTVCPGGGGIRGSLLDGDENSRRAAGEDIGSLLESCSKLGGAGLVLVPEFGAEKFMSLYPDHGDFERRKGVFVERLAPFVTRAEELGVTILLEPLNRYEAFFLLTVGQGAELCRMLGSASVRVLADMFHMGIEEDCEVAAFKDNMKWIGHVHLVDSNRKLPGRGGRDFSKALGALSAGGYGGYLCMECGLAGGGAEDIGEAVAFVRGVLG